MTLPRRGKLNREPVTVGGKCVVCQKPAPPEDRTTDGTFLHMACARPYQQWPR
jgi:hypothetical protein